MGKNKQTKPAEAFKQGATTGQHPSKKPKRDGKPRQKEHLEQIPFRLREIMKSKERIKMGPSKIKKMKKADAIALTPKPKPGEATIGDIPVPHFRRKKKESEKAYLRRMGNEAQHVLFLTKNQIERQPERELEEQEKSAGTGKCKSDKKKEYDKSRLDRLHKKKQVRLEEKAENDMFIDEVAFGEVAMAPPTLSIKPRKALIKPQGVCKGLLLNSLLGQTQLSTVKPSMARQRMMEEERQRVVQAYRHLKKQKQHQQEAKAAGIEKLKNLQ
ncbi:coiled-coil domain-containing protein 137 isoform X1 [Salvelinus alpinus]|uniref:coiled-coil domain-containing protein 137 isoform X1 n=1 Tax=Salvelinus alpinus TaxID=8036 RepID=UPI0039FD78EF